MSASEIFRSQRVFSPMLPPAPTSLTPYRNLPPRRSRSSPGTECQNALAPGARPCWLCEATAGLPGAEAKARHAVGTRNKSEMRPVVVCHTVENQTFVALKLRAPAAPSALGVQSERSCRPALQEPASGWRSVFNTKKRVKTELPAAGTGLGDSTGWAWDEQGGSWCSAGPRSAAAVLEEGC